MGPYRALYGAELLLNDSNKRGVTKVIRTKKRDNSRHLRSHRGHTNYRKGPVWGLTEP